MGESGDWEEPEDVAAGDVHDEVHQVGRLGALTAGVAVQQTLENHETGGEGERQEGDDVPAVGRVLYDQAVEDGAQDGAQDHRVTPGPGVEQSATGWGVGDQEDRGVHQDDQSDDGDEDDGENISDQTDNVVGEEEEESVEGWYD